MTPYVEYIALSGQTDFEVKFPYINRSHVVVRVNGLPTPIVDWPADNIARLINPIAAGSSVVVSRETPIEEQLVRFNNGAVLTEEDLNLAIQQLLYRQQEVSNLYERSLQAAQARLAANLGIVTVPANVSQELAELVLEQEVLDNFRQRIADIDQNAAAIIDQALSLDDVRTNLTALGADHESLKGTVEALEAIVGDTSGVAALIADEADARIDGDNALAATISVIGAKSGDNSAFVLDTERVKVSPTESLAERMSALSAADGANAASIVAEQEARNAADEALVVSIGALTTRVGAAESAITTEQTARSTAIAAEATARTNLAATLRSETTAAVAAEATARGSEITTAVNAEASARSTAISAAISSEATTRANADTVFAQNFTLLGARNAGGTAWVLNTSTVQIGGGVTLGTRLSGIDVSLGANSAAIVDEQTARVSADDALSTSIGTVSSNLGTLSASVSTLSSSHNGVLARYGVSLDSNGYVTGFVQNNNGSFGDFTVVADRFRVVQPGSSSPFAPFEVLGGVTYIRDALVRNASITSAKIGALEVDSINLAGSAVTTDKMAPSSVTRVTTFINENYVPGSVAYMANNTEYVLVAGSFTKEDSTSILKISVDATVWSENDVTMQLFIRLWTAYGTWENVIPNTPQPSSYSSAGRGWATGELGGKQSDWGLLIVSDGSADSIASATKTKFVFGKPAADYYVELIGKVTTPGSASGHMVLPGSLIFVEEVKR